VDAQKPSPLLDPDQKGESHLNVTSAAGAETPYVTAAPYSIVAVDLPRTSGSIDTMIPKR
jgi:hypothetical protein